MAEHTQRAYTLKLKGVDSNSQEWRQALWMTHEAVNKGAKVFGDWLLTMRGGLDHQFADEQITVKNKSPRTPTEAERRGRRIILALSWLSVESEQGAPAQFFVSHTHDTKTNRRSGWETVEALRDILKHRGLGDSETESWISDCKASLSATIRTDAVWVNRSNAFITFNLVLGGGLTSVATQATLKRFFGQMNSYLEIGVSTKEYEEGEGAGDAQKEFRTVARAWISENFGAGQKSDNATIASKLRSLAEVPLNAYVGRPGIEALKCLLQKLDVEPMKDNPPLDLLRIWIGWKGRPSSGSMAINRLAESPSLTNDDLENLRTKLTVEADSKLVTSDRKVPEWVTKFRKLIEENIRFPYRERRDHIGEFAVMLDHAARRVSGAHSWIKNAEIRRQQFEGDAQKIKDVPANAKTWLDVYCEQRGKDTGADEGYRIRRRALGDTKAGAWNEIVKAWRRSECISERDRITRARALQDDPELDKFGDIQLFEALAAEDAKIVWENGPDALINYVAAKEAEYNQRRFKVPAYRHPDPLRHPVFCDFGNSRWDIKFAIHQLRKQKKSRNGDEWTQNNHALRLGLWTGNGMRNDLPLCWQSKQLSHDLALDEVSETGAATISRAGRLSRAAAGVGGKPIVIDGLFEQKHWNGRLQVPRKQLDALAERVEKHGWDERAQKMRDRMGWFITFSAPLVPHGPWIEWAKKQGLSTNPKFWPHSEKNKTRAGMSRLLLSRLPGLRLLSVDLGHRHAAACAVWEVIDYVQLRETCKKVDIEAPGADRMYFHLNAKDNGKEHKTIYRRIGPDEWANTETGEISKNNASWARLDRQFTIKLQGEDEKARKVTEAERAQVKHFFNSLGYKPDEKLPLHVDELRTEVLWVARQGLKRNGIRARIAFNLITDKKLMSGGREETLIDEARILLLTDTLLDWHRLATDTRWPYERARQLWKEHIEPFGMSLESQSEEKQESDSPSQRKAREKALREKLQLVSGQLAEQNRMKVHVAWAQIWCAEDDKWRKHLRWLRNWLMPRGRQADDKTIRRVGGLSLTRIASFKSLYQIQKAYRMRPEPGNPRKNIPEAGDNSLENFGQSVLDTLEHLRVQRVKQLASRIAEAALGVGSAQHRIKKNKNRQTPRPVELSSDPRFIPCHAVVIENLDYYRPEEIRTRRENRQLMEWSSAKVGKYLAEACELHGLHLRQVPASYTSRQDSRTGMPGIRCSDVSVKDFLTKGVWRKQVEMARAKLKDGKNGSARDRYLVALDDYWLQQKEKLPQDIMLLRIPVRGGELFMSSSPQIGSTLQADLNAAANIGLKALLDPDWEGRWWYVPCDAKTGRSVTDKVKGSGVVDSTQPLQLGGEETGGKKEIINLWRDPSCVSLHNGSRWRGHAEYWNTVEKDVINKLRKQAGLPAEP